MYKADEGVLTSSSLTETESERGLFRLRERERRAREKSQREEPERLGRWTFLRRLAPMAGSVSCWRVEGRDTTTIGARAGELYEEHKQNRKNTIE